MSSTHGFDDTSSDDPNEIPSAKLPRWPQEKSIELLGPALDNLALAYPPRAIWIAYEFEEAIEKSNARREAKASSPPYELADRLIDALRARPAFWMAIPGNDLAEHPLSRALRDAQLLDLFIKANPSRALDLLTIPDSENPVISAMALASDPASALASLLAVGANPLAPSANNNTPLHAVCQRPFSEEALAAADGLIELGADPKALNDDGASAIHMAAASWPWASMSKHLSAAPIDLLGVGGIDGAMIAIEGTPPLISLLLSLAVEAFLPSGAEFIAETPASFARRELRALEIIDMALCPERSNKSALSLLASCALRGQRIIFKRILDELSARGAPPPDPAIFLQAIGRLIPKESYHYSAVLESGRLACMEQAVAAGVDLARKFNDCSRETTLFASVARIANSRNFITGGRTAQFEEILIQRGCAILRMGGAGSDDQSILEAQQEIERLGPLAADESDKIKNSWTSALEKEVLSLAASNARPATASTPKGPRL